MADVLVTVMMAVYNDVSMLPLAIGSVITQGIGDWELLIMDNSASNPEAWEILKQYSDSDERISVFKSPGTDDSVNVGWPKAASLLLEKAKGKYVFFLAADDMIAADAFLWLKEEDEKHDPDVVWVGNAYIVYKDGNAAVLDTTCPEYRVFDGNDKKDEVFYVLNNVYYNSMFHFSRTSFLKENEIDFFSPYYSDCAAMTAVLCKADKMVTLDKMVYYLTVNTSQTSGKVTVSFYNIFAMQWKLLREVYATSDDGSISDERKGYAAFRVFNNFKGNLENMLTGAPCRDDYMNPLEIGTDGRNEIAREALKDEVIRDMCECAGEADWVNDVLAKII